MTNQASASGGTVILAVGLGTLAQERLAVLRGSVDQVLEVLQEAEAVRVSEGDHTLLPVSAQEAPSAVRGAGARGGLLVTTEHPTKACQRFEDGYDVLWITEGGEPGTWHASPRSLDVEVRRALTTYLAGHRGADLVILGLEQLALYNDFPTLLAFVKDTLDLATLRGSRVYATLSPDALPPRERAVLARRFDVPTEATQVTSPPPSERSRGAPGNRILYRGPVS